MTTYLLSEIIPPPKSPSFTLTSATLDIAFSDSLSRLSEVRTVISIPLSCNCLSFGSACFTISSPACGTATPGCTHTHTFNATGCFVIPF